MEEKLNISSIQTPLIFRMFPLVVENLKLLYLHQERPLATTNWTTVFGIRRVLNCLTQIWARVIWKMLRFHQILVHLLLMQRSKISIISPIVNLTLNWLIIMEKTYLILVCHRTMISGICKSTPVTGNWMTNIYIICERLRRKKSFYSYETSICSVKCFSIRVI